MLTFKLVVLAVVVLPVVVELPVDVVEPELVELLEPPVDAVEVVPDEDDVDEEEDVEDAPPVPALLVDEPEVVVDVPLLASTLVTTNASAANDTCLALNSAIWPVVVPLGTLTWASLSLTTVTATPCVVPIHAESRPVKPVPCSVTTVPSGPLNGEKLMMYGWGTVVELPPVVVLDFDPLLLVAEVVPVVLPVLDFVIVKEFGEKDACKGFRTASWPVTASRGTVTSTLVSLST